MGPLLRAVKQTIDEDPSLARINKYIFPRGYLEREPKHLVEGTAVTAETYEVEGLFRLTWITWRT